MTMQALALAFLAATAIGGLAWVFIYPLLSGERKAESRRASIARSDAPARQAEKTQRSRREQVEGSLKEVEARRQKDKKVSLSIRLTQAGLSWTPQKFMIISAVLGLGCFAIAFLMGGGLLGAVGLDPSVLPRFPHEFSGGQRQRIGIARALALRPKFIVADEPVSALDVSVGAQIVNLLAQLQREFGLTYLFISHSMPVVRYLATRIAVMYRGKMVEVGDARQITEQPEHPYTRTLLGATPEITV